MNLLDTLKTADALTIDDDFVRYFTFDDDVIESDEYALLLAVENLDDCNFTLANCEAAQFSSTNNSWELSDGSDTYTIKAYTVTQIIK